MTDRATLRKAGEKATPGPWAAENTMGDIVMVFQEDAADINGWGPCVAQVGLTPVDDTDLSPEQAEANSDFIAAANPTAILSLLDRIETLEGVLRAIRRGCDGYAPLASFPTISAACDAALEAVSDTEQPNEEAA